MLTCLFEANPRL